VVILEHLVRMDKVGRADIRERLDIRALEPAVTLVLLVFKELLVIQERLEPLVYLENRAKAVSRVRRDTVVLRVYLVALVTRGNQERANLGTAERLEQAALQDTAERPV
jgi:hypothetical protein